MGYFRAFALMLLTLAACSRPSGDLSGHVFLLMQSGDVKRAGGIEVLIISATEGFTQEWNGLVKAYAEERKRLDAERKTAEASDAKAKAEYDEAFQAELKAMPYPGEVPLTLPGRKIPERAGEKREQAAKKSDQAREKWTEATVQAGEGSTDLLSEHRTDFEASRERPLDQSQANAVQDIARELEMSPESNGGPGRFFVVKRKSSSE